ncbi:MAG: aldo/keto reductase [Bryobacteraceae bacterium]
METRLALGTVELGLDYGFRGSAHYRAPTRADAIRVVHAALERGITLIDTAPAYGDAEGIIGEALAGRGASLRIATKVTVTESCGDIRKSVEASLRALRMERVWLLQVHNATLQVLERPGVVKALVAIREAGLVERVGASTYGEPAALAALSNAEIGVLQVPYNILDQQLARRVFPAAGARGVAVLARSAFLRGVLTPRIAEAPGELAPLRDVAYRAYAAAGVGEADYAAFALRYCLSNANVDAVIVGVRSEMEVDAAVDAARQGPLSDGLVRRLDEFSMSDHPLITPQSWTNLI